MAGERRSVERILDDKRQEVAAFSGDVEALLDQTLREVRQGFLQELDQVLTGDLKDFQRKLVRTLTQSGLELLTPHLEGAFGAIGGGALSTSLGRIARDQDVAIPGSVLEQLPTARSSGGFEGTLNQAVFAAVSSVLNRTRTRTHSAESERSREVEAQFRASRGQAQALAAQEVARGQRNL